jgi:hypothetical protein
VTSGSNNCRIWLAVGARMASCRLPETIKELAK